MKMEITEKKENAILKRTEVRFVIDHAGEATPTKGAVVDEIAKQTKAKRTRSSSTASNPYTEAENPRDTPRSTRPKRTHRQSSPSTSSRGTECRSPSTSHPRHLRSDLNGSKSSSKESIRQEG